MQLGYQNILYALSALFPIFSPPIVLSQRGFGLLHFAFSIKHFAWLPVPFDWKAKIAA